MVGRQEGPGCRWYRWCRRSRAQGDDSDDCAVACAVGLGAISAVCVWPVFTTKRLARTRSRSLRCGRRGWCGPSTWTPRQIDHRCAILLSAFAVGLGAMRAVCLWPVFTTKRLARARSLRCGCGRCRWCRRRAPRPIEVGHTILFSACEVGLGAMRAVCLWPVVTTKGLARARSLRCGCGRCRWCRRSRAPRQIE
jgi:hypothetical protein